ncbi:type II secretion system protein [Ammoniphilus sp. YIM 78166]|uniref:type II secretion system protein n=1 Tax=Ammoniphilus sp. YIM 78166 TaxID=1644106 RepID=UPI00106F1652|nr:type II secretion system protein [Ammoniphilus sp. YIM 78166]
MKFSCEKGLTLIEVIAATALLSIIAMILSAVFTKNIERTAKDDQSMSSIHLAQHQMQSVKQFAQSQPDGEEWGRIPSKNIPKISLPDGYQVRVETSFVPSGTKDVLKIKVETTDPFNQMYTLTGYIGRGRTQ